MAKPNAVKPDRPYPEFPLFPHAAGVWAKKIKGRMHYFGPWNDPDAALAKYRREVDDLQAGLTPRQTVAGGITLREVLNHFLSSKSLKLANGELTAYSFADYQKTCALLVAHFGKDRRIDDIRPEDFRGFRSALAKGPRGPRGLVSVSNHVRRSRSVFLFAYESDLIDKPIKFGPDFKTPSVEAIRRERQTRPKRLFDAKQLQTILGAATVPLQAMTLLGINAGLGPTDLANLPKSALDLRRGWIDFPRIKTAARRRAKLWPETVAAIKAAIAERPEPVDPSHADLVFITKRGQQWVRTIDHIDDDGKVRHTFADAIGQAFNKILVAKKLKHESANFYAVRHTFRTVADGTKDAPAIDLVMGHTAAASDMAARYREEIADERLEAVAAYVRNWLWPKPVKAAKKAVAKQ